MKRHPKTHLLAKLVSLAHLQGYVCKLERVDAQKMDKLGALGSIIPFKFLKIDNPD